MPHLNAVYEKYKAKGLEVIGVHTTNGADKMAAFAGKAKIAYPIAKDIGGKTVAAFRVDSFPDYYVVDRAGNLRVADLANAELDRVVALLLKEKPPQKKPETLDAEKVLAAGLARATKQNKRLLVHIGAPW